MYGGLWKRKDKFQSIFETKHQYKYKSIQRKLVKKLVQLGQYKSQNCVYWLEIFVKQHNRQIHPKNIF